MYDQNPLKNDRPQGTAVDRDQTVEPLRAAIFDFDGTLIDSMKMWHTIPSSYARSLGKEPDVDFDEKAKYLSLEESAEEFRRMYGIRYTNEEIIGQIMDMVHGFYRETLPLKPGVREILQEFREKGIRMCIATMTPSKMIYDACTRLDILDYFEAIYSCSDYGIGKDTPDIYDMAAEKMGVTRRESIVFEDMVRAVITAHRAGYRVVGIRDEESRKDWERITAESDLTMDSPADWPGLEEFAALLHAKDNKR